MADTYTTKQGDTFESIAWFQMGDSDKMVDLIRENREHMETAVFPAGAVLTIPETTQQKGTEDSTTPPWRAKT